MIKNYRLYTFIPTYIYKGACYTVVIKNTIFILFLRQQIFDNSVMPM